MVRDPSGEATLLTSWVGLGRRSPLAAVVFSVFLLSFAGIPLTSGFIGKWAVFAAAWNGGAHWLVVVAVVISVIAAFFYIRVIVLMFFSEPTSRSGGRGHARGWTTLVAVGVGVVATVALGLFPGPLLDLAQAARGVRPLSHNGDLGSRPVGGGGVARPPRSAARRTRIEE